MPVSRRFLVVTLLEMTQRRGIVVRCSWWILCFICLGLVCGARESAICLYKLPRISRRLCRQEILTPRILRGVRIVVRYSFFVVRGGFMFV